MDGELVTGLELIGGFDVGLSALRADVWTHRFARWSDL